MRLSPSRQLKTLLTAALLLCLPQIAHAQDYTSNLIGHWTLDETSGASIADSASTNTGTWTDSANDDVTEETTVGRIGTAITFDGINDIINAGTDTSLDTTDNTHTISFWIRKSAANSAGDIVSKGQGSVGGYTSGIGIHPCGANEFKATKFGVVDICFGAMPADTNWHHIVTVWNTDGVRVYVDGTQNAFNSDTSNFQTAANPLIIGNGPNGYFDGTIDDVRIYSRALSAADITALYAYTGINYTCANPDGVTGVIYFNDDEKVLQYCNGSNWASIGPQSSLTSGLAAHWTLDETSGASIADNTGTNTGTWTDGVNNNVAEETTAGQVNTALSFDGIDDEITISGFQAMTAPFSFSAWMNPNAPSTASKYALVIQGDNTNFYIKWDSNFGPAETLGFFSTTGSNVQTSIGTVTPGQWHHIVGTFDGTILRAYNNGIEVSTTASTLIPRSAGSPTIIGSEFNGNIDDIRIYNRLLSATEVQELYNQTVPTCSAPSSNLAAHWTLDETSGSSIADSTGTNTGTWTDGANNDVTEETVAGQINTALSFDETDDIVTVPHHASLDINTAYTVSGWVYFDSSAAASPKRPSLISKNDTGGWGSGWVIGRTSGGGDIIGGNIRLAVQHDRNSSSPNADYSGWVYPVDTWNYVTITWDGNTVNYYLNAALVDTGTITIPPDTGAGDLLIGYGRSNWYTRYHAGRIDDLRIYDRALPLLQIQELYGASGGSCTVSNCASPFGVKSEIVFNSDYNIMQYCNGNEWQAFQGGCPASIAPNAKQGYFVLTNTTYDGNIGGANDACLTDLQANNWLGKSSATISSENVKAFLCTNSGFSGWDECAQLTPNTEYFFAKSGDTTAGGASFTSTSQGYGPGDNANWSGATYFNGSYSYWTGVRTSSATLWGDETASSDHECTEYWDDNSAGAVGRTGSSNNTDDDRWNDVSVTCDQFNHLICIVHPQ